MRNTALALAAPSAPAVTSDAFTLPELRVYTSIPDYRCYGIATLRGGVVVYEDCLCREGVVEGAFYVVENQNTPANMGYDRWLEEEWDGAARRAQPRSPLKVSRRVVQLVRHPKMANHWLRRESSGFSDGPFPDWSVGFNLIGRVVGIYAPEFSGTPAREAV